MRNYNSKAFSLIFAFLLICLQLTARGQVNYRDQKNLSQILKDLNTQHSNITTLESLVKTETGEDIWILTIGKGDVKNHPGLAIVGGVDGSYLTGVELSLRFAEQLLANSKEDSISNLLDSITFYILPNVSPDATSQYFSSLQYNRNQNGRITDDDRDGRFNEDGFEDLNKDGMITQVRIKDPKGEWMIHPDDSRVMIKANKKEGEMGNYMLISEGIDNDKDKWFNEDGEGGISFNSNMTFQFPHFKTGAGEYPVSEIESRAVLDFLYDQWNIYAVLTFGPSDNLSQPIPYNKAETEQKVLTGLLENDAEINAYVSKRYNEITGDKDHTKMTKSPGDFMQWVYFHYGRQSFSTPAFYIPEIKFIPDSASTITIKKPDYDSDINYLRWADSILQETPFVDWTTIEHPDFPGRITEVGGVFPHARYNAPTDMLDSLSNTHNQFIVFLASLRPRIKVINMNSTLVSKNVFRIEMEVYNEGYLPALSGVGEKTKWIKKPKINIELNEKQEILSGKPVVLLDDLKGDQAKKISWLVNGKGKVKINVGSPQTGIQNLQIELK